jgi:hypothetical protein
MVSKRPVEMTWTEFLPRLMLAERRRGTIFGWRDVSDSLEAAQGPHEHRDEHHTEGAR